MGKKRIIAVVLSVVLAACTSAGAPEPGERALDLLCQDGNLKVCTGNVGSRILKENPTCSCN
jgi:hypothetical protein